MPLPDFLIIGAMKCGTTTLQAQLAAQPGVFMATPKEPNFFSDDAIYARGMDWYEDLFRDAPPGALKGEGSTHYTKLPTYPECAARLVSALPDVRLIYLVRNPVVRMVSHFMHEWSLGNLSGSVEEACIRHPEITAYSCYARQIEPYVQHYGPDRILVLSLEELQAAPQEYLELIGDFIRMKAKPVWRTDLGQQNVSSERVRRFPFYRLLVDNPVATTLRRRLVPKAARDAVKAQLTLQERPEMPQSVIATLKDVFADDFAEFERLLPGQAPFASYKFLTA